MTSENQGYYRFPTIHGNTVVFASEGDLWTVDAGGGMARRLTSNPGQASTPALSPDGTRLAFTGRDEGHSEVYCMPAEGGPATRLTYFGADSRVVGWLPGGEAIVFASNTAQPFLKTNHLFTVPPEGGDPQRLATGPAMSISHGPNGGAVIGRNTTDIARWKRYRGGLTGDLWIDETGAGTWRRLIGLDGNVTMPLWVGGRIYFVSDHEGIGNLYSCLPSGDALQRHTHHDDYYVRHPATDGRRIVYHAGGDLYLFEPASGASGQIDVDFRSPRVERKRRFVSASRYLQGYSIHPEGHAVALTVRGKPFSMSNWEGAVVQHGETDGVRYRLATWLSDGKRLVVVGDAPGEETLEVHHADASQAPERLEGLDVGRPVNLVAAPKGDRVALSNHRNELILVDLEAGSARVLDRSRHDRIYSLAWSPDARWIAYGFAETMQTSIIKLCEVESGATHAATEAVLLDTGPAFDPDGKFLYFLSRRDFNPVYDNLHFDLNFPRGARPYLITLQADTPSPFVPQPRAPGAKPGHDDDEDGDGDGDDAGHEEEGADETDGADNGDTGDASEKGKGNDEDKPLQIDLEGITERVLAFPVPEGRYGQIRGIKGKALFTTLPVLGTLGGYADGDDAPPAARLDCYSLEDQKLTTLVNDVGSFEVSGDAKSLVYRTGGRLRVIKAGEKPPNDSDSPSRKSGWLNLNRIRVSVDPGAEWAQMYREAWRLQRDHFWTEDMSGIDWQTIYQRYYPLVARIASRAEFSDLMWEMQGELGTSHAYEFGGDYPPEPIYAQGFLGADLAYDTQSESYRVADMVSGDVWDPLRSSPLARAGVDVQPGDRLVAVNGRPVGPEVSPAELLVNQAGNEVVLTLQRDGDEGGEGAEGDAPEPRTVTVKTLYSERAARYRQWVEENRRRVHEATGGRVGYVHIPDMGPAGYAEFHRGFLAEVDREGLIVDARYNGGGHVSQLILEKLARRRLGYDTQRWGQPIPYPYESVMGPLVALANEQAGSDGDIFTHAFKMMKLGPLIGKRTWGGVIGINMRNSLVDGGMTTQPEYSFWFQDVQWGLENYGTEPDIEVEIRPQDAVAGADPQLDRAITEILVRMDDDPPALPEFGDRPQLKLPRLPEV